MAVVAFGLLKPMIIIKIEGGLGNQMFQYALGRNLSLLHNTTFKIDTSYLRSANQSGRSFKLDNFNTIINEATPEEINKYRSIFQKILDRVRSESKKKKILEPENFDPNILKRKEGYFYGHWNNKKYFKNNENTIRNDFKLKKPFGKSAQIILEKINSSSNSVSIHIRRGDYVSIKKIADKHGTLPISYYENAMKKIKDKYSNTTFFVFSDDIEWVKNHFFKKYSVNFVSSPDIEDYEELILMSLCKHNIIANSTFSWWGAWLNNNPDKIIIAPKKWFKNNVNKTNDLILDNWIQL